MSTALENLSTDELEQLLQKRKKAETEKLKKARKAYEDKREAIINELSQEAQELQDKLIAFKKKAFETLLDFREQMLDYGDVRNGENNKGNFEIKNDQLKILFSKQVRKQFDERASLAEEHISRFLNTFVKKKDRVSFDLVTSLLKRNEETGKFDINLINRLYKLEDRFDNPDWKKGIQLFKEAYNEFGTASYIRFFKKNEKLNGFDPVVLEFSRLQIDVEKK